MLTGDTNGHEQDMDNKVLKTNFWLTLVQALALNDIILSIFIFDNCKAACREPCIEHGINMEEANNSF